MPIHVLVENRALKSKVRNEVLNGRSYLVAPVTLIVPGVLNGNQGPLYYPQDEVTASPHIWNGTPIILEHSYSPQGEPISARDPAVLNTQGLGYVFSSKNKDGSAKAEAWFDVEITNSRDARLLEDIRNGNPVEISTGLLTDNDGVSGVYQGIAYNATARNYRADHLAIIRQGKGACSVVDGCGVNNKGEGGEGLTTETKPKQNEGSAMPLTKEQRDQLVTTLVANCDCDKTKKSFQDMTDNQLELIGNAMDVSSKEAAAKAIEDKEKEEEEEKKKMTANSNTTPINNTTNTATTNSSAASGAVLAGMSYDDLVSKIKEDMKATHNETTDSNEWFKSAPPEIKRMVDNAVRVEQQAKQGIIDQLTTNLSGDVKAATAERLADKDLDDLELMLNLSGKTQRVTNWSAASAPSTSSGVPNRQGGHPTVNREAILPLPSMSDYESEAG